MDPVAQQLISRLQRNPQDYPAYEALKDHYRNHGDIPSLVNLVVGWASQAQDGPAAAEAFVEAAGLLRGVGEQEERRLGLYQEALSRDGLSVGAMAGIQDLRASQGHLNQYATWLSSHIAKVQQEMGAEDGARLGDLYALLGGTMETLGDAASSSECYSRAEHLRANAQSGKARESERKVQTYLEAAQHAVERNGDLDSAIATLREALRELPGDVQIMHQLSSYLLERAHRDPQQPNALDLRRAAELLYQIAQGLIDVPSECVPYLEAALAACPDHDGALSLLEQVAPQSGQSERLPSYWVAYLEQAAPGPEADRRRLALGRAYALAGQIDDAIYCLEQLPRNNAEASALLSSLVTNPDTGAESMGDAARPPRPRRPTPGEAKRADDAARVAALHKEVHRLVSLNEQEEAADRCRDIIDIDPTDPEAYFFLESHYRRKRAFLELRELLLSSTRTTGLPIDKRRERLLEVAHLSERKLNDVDTAIAALQSVVTLSSADSDAARTLKRLLKEHGRWDELVDLLEREALSATAVDEKVDLLKQLASVHRDKRNDLSECAQALSQLHELQPDDPSIVNQLIDTLVVLRRHADAAPMLFARAKAETDSTKRMTALRDLLELCEQELHDNDFTYEVAQALHEDAPQDMQPLLAMERIDQDRDDASALLRTLRLQAEISEGSARSSLLIRMANLFEEQEDTDRAADALTQAVKADPNNDAAVQALSALFERAGRHQDLADLLSDQASRAKEPEFRAACLRQLGRLADELLGDRERAKTAFVQLLEVDEDLEALEYLSGQARDEGDATAEAGYLQRLAAVLDEPQKRRDTLYDLALLQRDDLQDGSAAEATLSRLLETVDATFEPAINALRDLAQERGSKPGQRLALRCTLQSLGTEPASIPVAQDLATLCAEEPQDLAQARVAYEHWMAADPESAEPVRALVALLTDLDDQSALRDALDELALREPDAEAQRAAALRAARVGFEQLDDSAYTWNRLQPLVEQHDEEACGLMLEVCRQTGWVDRLTNLHIASAQSTQDTALQHAHWKTAARLLQDELGERDRALQAALRALATDTSDRDVLGMVEQLCLKTRAHDRLDQVYERLIKQADDEGKLSLLLRHATLLEQAGRRRETAFAQLARASMLRPEDATLLTRMEALAVAAEPQLPMLAFYEKRLLQAQGPEARQEELLRAARFCESQALQRDAAMDYLVRALAEAEPLPALIAPVIATAVDFDTASGGDEHSALRALIGAQRTLAKDASHEFSRLLVLGAASLQEEQLDEPSAALDTLRSGMANVPGDEDIYQEARRLALQLGREEALEAHLVKLAAEAVDAQAAVALLRRQADLLEHDLKRPEAAVSVYAKLSQLQPNDRALADRLRSLLKRTARYQDLLVALKKQVDRAQDEDERVAALRDIARTWDGGLRNRYEALEAWQKVRANVPGDAEATAALARLSPGVEEPTFAEAPWGPDTEPTVSAARSATSQPRSEATTDADTDLNPMQGDVDEGDEGDLASLSADLDVDGTDEPEELTDLSDVEEVSESIPEALLPGGAGRSLPPPPPEQALRRSVPPAADSEDS